MFKVVGWSSRKVYFTTEDKQAAERYMYSWGFFEIVSIETEEYSDILV